MKAAPDSLEKRWQRRSGMVTRRVAGEVILVPVAQKVDPQAALYTLDPVAAFLWEKIGDDSTGRALSEALQSAYEVEPARADADVSQFLDALAAIGAVAEVLA